MCIRAVRPIVSVVVPVIMIQLMIYQPHFGKLFDTLTEEGATVRELLSLPFLNLPRRMPGAVLIIFRVFPA